MAQTEQKPVNHYDYLDNLRERGVTNMFGAVPFLRREFPDLSEEEARQILLDWMHHCKERKTEERLRKRRGGR